jgi:hypothetical protein
MNGISVKRKHLNKPILKEKSSKKPNGPAKHATLGLRVLKLQMQKQLKI